ncbi:D-2-hydroxyacid dehydrogenase [Paenibacillus radicis (ex Xue et al. 2023)]|uniref:D-2-hydroxyacid dehydrogenase n=1 Tax=Paenibacillus radicis (ex Xue et al. 2023) TaxID=2972489 RepID=A0ABT1YN84_9BACL|nr:D-2-hydroxyacid dehydrogenase [Paenibacillus radicis (ex Xue et al. 2023)]MCR8634190.1 D-2-hydroxyacid dehydrogenase [Paenibacillus radicis (ex Xue et al. 2023)]
MNIVVLDGFTLNPGDLDWGRLEALGNLTVYERTLPEQLMERAAEANLLLTNKTPLSKETLTGLPYLRYIGVLATGYNVVDVQAAASRGIPVTNVPTYGTHSVAQFVFALLLELCHRVQMHGNAVRDGEWVRSSDFCFTRSSQVELQGRTLGLIGLGKIGSQTAQIAAAFGMKVLAVGSGRTQPAPVAGVEWVSLNDLLRLSDVISLHCPLTPETTELINTERIRMMKPSAFLINTSRGPLIHEQDLADALCEGRLAGAGLDVLSVEPPLPSNPLLSAPNCIVTPHIAWATKDARGRLMDTAVGNVRAFLMGEPINVVNRAYLEIRKGEDTSGSTTFRS